MAAATESATEALEIFDRYEPEIGFTERVKGLGRLGA
jgi:hypothetical protein